MFASIFQPAESCIKENGFYLEVIPSLLQLQRERGFGENELIDIFIHCYGARLSQNPGTRSRGLTLNFESCTNFTIYRTLLYYHRIENSRR